MKKLELYIPLLVPSFSSKGSLFIKKEDGMIVSDNLELMEMLDIRLSSTYLVSAYDAYYGYISSNPADWPETDYLFVDSGGYETSNYFDSDERNKFNYYVGKWNEEMMLEVYRKVYSCEKFKNTTIIFSCFDSYSPFHVQLMSAVSISDKFPNAIVNFLMKPSFGFANLLNEIPQYANELSKFQILGITEKELGETVQERLKNLIRLKEQLMSIDWDGKLHIFGGLEPLMTVLYYIAGAEIFDGLSWQRIRYSNGTGLLDINNYRISCNDYENKYKMMLENLAYLNSQAIKLPCEIENRDDIRRKLSAIIEKDGLTLGELFRYLGV